MERQQVRAALNLASLEKMVALEGMDRQQPGFEVLAITAGEGNGWVFNERCLRDSLPLWDGVECFVDHGWNGRSIRDLAGTVYEPQWDEVARGIRCKLRPMGPSGPLLSALGREIVAGAAEVNPLREAARAARLPQVGFSADLLFTSDGKKVREILRVLSVDLVMDPARGGAFLRALNATNTQGEDGMADNEEVGKVEGSSSKVAALQDHQRTQFQREIDGLRGTYEAQQAQLQAEAEAARQARAQVCGYLLDSALAASKLPQAAAERVRKQFSGRVFEPGKLTAAIDDARKLVSELTAGAVVQGMGRVHAMYSSEDQFSAALHDLLGAKRPEELQGVKPAKLRGIRELYTLMTGDVDFAGGYDGSRAQFAVTADLPGVLKNAMNKLIVQEWEDLGRSGYRWWEPVVSVEHFTSLHQITGVLVGEVDVLPAVAEAAPYTSLGVADSPETADWVKYGAYIGLTLEMFERDETHKIRVFPKKLASAGLRRISALVANVFLANGGTGPLMADGNAVFSAAHSNLDALPLTGANWETTSGRIYQQQMVVDAGVTPPVLALDAKYCIVPRSLRLAAMRILYPSWEREANFVSENLQRGEMGDVITCPEFTDADDWAAAADPRLAPGILIGERFGLLPEIIVADQQVNGALFTNDEIRLKARHWLAVFVADHRPLYKNNVP